MDTSQGDEINLPDQELAEDSLEAQDAQLANAITQGLSTEPVSKQQVIEALQPPSPKSSRLP